jgi:RNA polymerase sigma factor (sigma-70 family)
MTAITRELRCSACPGDGDGLTDEQLLTDFVERRDEAAFADLVLRHGPMVWRVCRRVLANPHDAEDAFQATFLVLVVKAAAVRPRALLANWLYGVARTTAHRARAAAARRRVREGQVTPMPEHPAGQDNPGNDLRAVLDLELSRLPAKYRVLVVLCDLEDRSRKEVARRLGIPEGTVAGRLARGRSMLAKRLARRGLAVPGGALAAALPPHAASAGVPRLVLSATVRAASLRVTGRVPSGEISVRVTALSEGVLRGMSLHRLKLGAVALLVATLACCGVSAGVGTVPRPATAGTQPDAKSNERRAGEPPRTGRYDLLCTAGKYVVEKADPGTGTVKLSRGHHVFSFRQVDETGREPSVPYCGVSELFRVEPTTRVIIDGKVARLADLRAGSSVFVKYVVKNRTDLEERHDVVWIEAVGSTVGPGPSLIRSVNLAENSLTAEVGDRDNAGSVTGTYRVARDARVVVDGEEVTFADLKPNMRASLRLAVPNGPLVVRVTAAGPKVDAVVRAVDGTRNRITVRVKDTHLAAQDVPVARNAKVVLGGQEGKLSDLRVGMTVTLQMSAESDPGFVVGIRTGTAVVLARAIEVLKTSPSCEQLWYAAAALEKIGKPAVPALLELLAESDEGIRKDILLNTLDAIRGAARAPSRASPTPGRLPTRTRMAAE